MTTLEQFLKLAKFSDDGTTRVYVDAEKCEPVAAGLMHKGGTASAVGMGEYYAEDAWVVDALERAIVTGCDGHQLPERNAAAALHVLRKHHQGAAPLLQRDLANLVMILKAEEHVLEKYELLQSLADTFCHDPRFVQLIKAAFPGISASAKQSASEAVQVKELAGTLCAPVGLITKCYDICCVTDRLEAAKHVRAVAEALGAPLASQLADVLYDSYWQDLNKKGLDVTFSTISLALSPKATSLPGKAAGGLAHFLPGSVTSSASAIMSGTKYLVSKLNATTAHETVPLPVFAIRRDRKGSEAARPEAGRDKVYSLSDRKTVIALLQYLGMPVLKELPHDHTSPIYRMEEARLVMKSLLGSPLWEDASVEIPRGMAPDEYIFEKLGNTEVMKYTAPATSWKGVKARQTLDTHLRPPSFVRLLCVAAGLASEHSSGTIYRDGKGFSSMMAASFGSAPKEAMWQHAQESDFDHFLAGKKVVDEYRVEPWMQHLPHAIAEDSELKQHTADIAIEPYAALKSEYEKKLRWLCDAEMSTCAVCHFPIKAGNRHHCRVCGKLVCGDHNKKLALLSKESNAAEKERVCSDCARHPGLAKVYALRPGDVRAGLP